MRRIINARRTIGTVQSEFHCALMRQDRRKPKFQSSTLLSGAWNIGSSNSGLSNPMLKRSSSVEQNFLSLVPNWLRLKQEIDYDRGGPPSFRCLLFSFKWDFREGCTSTILPRFPTEFNVEFNEFAAPGSQTLFAVRSSPRESTIVLIELLSPAFHCHPHLYPVRQWVKP
jgi:hypothetical protein